MIRCLVCVLLAEICVTASGEASTCTNTSTGNVPLTELGSGTYQGFQGGLYPGGTNVRPAAFEAAGQSAAAQIAPLNGSGAPDPNGWIVLLSIGMSNTSLEFAAFIPVANADPAKNQRLVLVNGAQGGIDAVQWADPQNPCWNVAESRLQGAGVTPMQVEAIWLKQSIAGEQPTGAFPTDAVRLQGLLQDILENAKVRYPNVKVAYVSNRIYAGYGSREPFAYWTGFSVKWLVEANLQGNPTLPWTAWGPYLWADGTTPRNDGLTWVCSDFMSDGIHPAGSGQQKVVTLLLNFFKTDPTATPWFVRSTTGVPDQQGVRAVRLLLSPNPMRDRVAITREDGGALSHIGLYDMEGRLIRVVPQADTGVRAIWDGRDLSGCRVPSGIYLVRMPGLSAAKLVVRN